MEKIDKEKLALDLETMDADFFSTLDPAEKHKLREWQRRIVFDAGIQDEMAERLCIEPEHMRKPKTISEIRNMKPASTAKKLEEVD